MEAFECGTEACSAERAASGALDSDLGHRAILPLLCGLFGCMACMSVTQRRQRTAEEPLVGQGGQKRLRESWIRGYPDSRTIYFGRTVGP